MKKYGLLWLLAFRAGSSWRSSVYARVDERGFYEAIGQRSDHVGRSRDQSIGYDKLQDMRMFRQESCCKIGVDAEVLPEF